MLHVTKKEINTKFGRNMQRKKITAIDIFLEKLNLTLLDVFPSSHNIFSFILYHSFCYHWLEEEVHKMAIIHHLLNLIRVGAPFDSKCYLSS